MNATLTPASPIAAATPPTGPDARYPIALLPLRLETRFSGTILQVRIFPDEIFADTHEPGLTSDETRDGATYVATIGSATEAQSWGALVSRYTAPRAAWIALASAKGSPAARADSWTRAAQALLPDSWIVRVYQGGKTFTATIANVQRPLALTVTPTSAPQVAISDALTVDADLEWTVHFDAAVAAGMAVAIDLSQPDGHPPVSGPATVLAGSLATAIPTATMTAPAPRAAAGVLLAAGVKTLPSEAIATPIAVAPISVTPVQTPPAPLDVFVVGVVNQTPDAGAAQLHELLDAQHYTRGVAFVAPGTPTSNSDDGPAGFPTPDPGGAHSFAVERQAPLVVPNDGSDGDRFARALGLVASGDEKSPVVEHVDGAARAQEPIAAAMNAAMWPVTLGYFMQQMMAPKFDAATIETARQYFLANVRPAGPMAAFRVGRVPYGLLPTLSLTRYAPDGLFSSALRVLRDNYFTQAVSNVPRVSPDSSDPDGDLLKALAVDASCRQMRMRLLLGQDVASNTAGLFGLQAPLQVLLQARAAAAAALLANVGLGADTRLGHVDPGASANLINAPLVTSAPLSESTGVTYIQTLIDWAGATPIDFASIRDDKLPGIERPLLYRLLRHALLLEMDRVSILTGTITATTGVLTTDIAAATPAATTTAPAAPTTAPIALTTAATAPIAATLQLAEPELVNLGTEVTATAYGRIAASLAVVGFSSELGPYLDSLRVLATLPSAELDRRFGETLDSCSHRLDAWITSLATARLATLRAGAPTGCHVGAFGWVENLLPGAASPPPPAGGFIHAPSAGQASAAAILLNGYLSRGGGGSPYAVNLGSARTRSALQIIDGTRQGEPLAALLGFRFERALHDADLDKLIAPLRSQFPLVAGRTPAGAGAVELVAASTVVDGLALRAAQPQPPGLTTAESTSFQRALALLDDAVDGVADVLTAESVFQAVRANPNAAVASLDAMAQGVLPPDVDVARTPLGGATFTQRVALVLDGTVAATVAATPRAAAEPVLDAWVGTLLGDMTQIGCQVVAADGTTTGVTLAALNLRPLDVVALCKTPPTGAGDGELDRRILAAAATKADSATGLRVRYDASNVAHSFAECLELARVIAAFIGGARALAPADLVAPADALSATTAPATAQQAAARAQAALTSMTATSATLGSALSAATLPTAAAGELAALRAALQSTAHFGVLGAFPDPAAAAPELIAAATAALAELAVRQAAVPALSATDPATLLADSQQAMQSIFGRDFFLLPQVTAPDPASLSAALAESAGLIGDPNLPRKVLQQLARVRPALGRWRSLFLYTEALGTAAQMLDVAQLPPQQATWAAVSENPPASGTLSLILHRPAQTAPSSAWAGLVVDEWNELIPAATQPTAVSFRHETPVAEAPQAVLLAVPPTTAAASWDNETLIDTVRETLALAKLRLVDTVDELRPFLPAICLTGNTANETVSSNFFASLIADPVIVSGST
jgi:hypothetical protein